MPTLLDLTKRLLACPSITPHDAHAQALIKDFLMPLGFHCETLQFNEVKNLYAKLGDRSPLMVFAGHTDVVPPGPLADWDSPPFEPEVRDNVLYGRGACDMKGALAAMLHATHSFLQNHADFAGSIAFLLTSDEEGPSIDGTKRVVEWLQARHEKIDYCIVGEPSSKERIGDQIRVGRRGSLHGKLHAHGKQGHVAYPDLAQNAIHVVLPALAKLTEIIWDEGNQDFPPTSFQITNLSSGTGALNVVPGLLTADFNFRFSTASTIESLQTMVKNIFDEHVMHYKLDWTIGAQPFLTKDGRLRKIVTESVKKVMGYDAIPSTGGGTSDGRFIAVTGAEIVELGLLHHTAHQVNEHVAVSDLEALAKIYERILINCFCVA